MKIFRSTLLLVLLNLPIPIDACYSKLLAKLCCCFFPKKDVDENSNSNRLLLSQIMTMRTYGTDHQQFEPSDDDKYEDNEIRFTPDLTPNNQEKTVFHRATQQGDWRLLQRVCEGQDGQIIVMELLRKDIDGKTSIWYAIQHGWNPLHLVALSGNDEAVNIIWQQYQLTHSQQVDSPAQVWLTALKAQDRLSWRHSPIHYAVLSGNPFLIKAFIQRVGHRALIEVFNIQDGQGRDSFQLAHNTHRWTLLHLAAMHPDVNVLNHACSLYKDKADLLLDLHTRDTNYRKPWDIAWLLRNEQVAARIQQLNLG